MNLYKDIKKNYKKIVEKDILMKKNQKKAYSYCIKSNFISKNIQKEMKQLIYGYIFTYKNNTIYYFTQNQIQNQIPKIIIHMFQIIVLLKNIFNRDTHKQKIIYFETNKKKEFPIKKKILGSNEINSGVTVLEIESSINNGLITIYRKEECCKVLIHELIHSNLIDLKIILSNKKSNDFTNLFCTNYKILLNEAFTETFATFINMFYIHIFNKLKKKELETMFLNELNYSNTICNSILKYNHITDISKIMKQKNICNQYFLQNTNVFSYYILKNVLLSNYIKFGYIIHKYSHNYTIMDELYIDEMIDFIMNDFKNSFNNRIQSNYNKNSLNNGLNNSLKMCFHFIS